MTNVRVRVPMTAIAVLALILGTTAGASAATSAPVKPNPKDVAIAKVATLKQADVPATFIEVAAKITTPKASGIKACKPNEKINKVTKNKAKTAFETTDQSSIESTVDVFKNRAAMKKAVAIIDSNLTIDCLEQSFKKQLAKNKGLKATVGVIQQPLELGDVATSFVATIVVTSKSSGQTQTVTSYAGFVGAGRVATQVIYTDTSGAFDPAVPTALMTAAATNLAAAQP